MSIHIFLASLSMMQVRNACPYDVRVGVVFHSGRARPTEVFKLVLSLGAQITRTGTYAHTHRQARAVLLIAMALEQKQK